MSSNEPDEFSFLAEEATAVGRATALPPVARVQPSTEISALAWGQGAATTVLAHGVALNAHTWDATVLAWPQPAPPMLAVDLPGHGDSDWLIDGDYAPARLSALTGAALGEAQRVGALDPVPVMVGHSLGGLVGLELVRAGVELARLVLVDILPLPASAARTVADFLNGPTSFASREEIVQRAMAFGFGGSPDSLRRGVFHNTRMTAEGRVIWKHHFGQLGGSGFAVAEAETVWPVIAASPVPIDLVLANNSFIDQAAVQRFRDLRPDARVRRLDGGHNLQEDNPIALARTLAELIG